MTNLTTCVPNYTQIYFSYSTVTFACQGRGLACSRNVTIFTCRQVFITKTKCLYRYWNEIKTVNQLQFNYFTNIHIDTAIYEKFVCYNHNTKYTDWCPIPNDGGWGICLRMWKPVKEISYAVTSLEKQNRSLPTSHGLTRFYTCTMQLGSRFCFLEALFLYIFSCDIKYNIIIWGENTVWNRQYM